MTAATPDVMGADSGRGLDVFGWFIANLHQLLGHDTAAAMIGQPRGDKNACLLCQHERRQSDATRLAVIKALAAGERKVTGRVLTAGGPVRVHSPSDAQEEGEAAMEIHEAEVTDQAAIHAAALAAKNYGWVTYLTRDGKRVGAVIVSRELGEAIEAQMKTDAAQPPVSER